MAFLIIRLNVVALFVICIMRNAGLTSLRDGKLAGSGARMTKLLLPASAAHAQSLLTTAGATGYTPYSPNPVGGPPPAHQSPRHVPFTAHPLPAHLHPVMSNTSGLHHHHHHAGLAAGVSLAAHLHPQMAPMYVNSPTGGAYLAHPVSPSKARQLQYQYVYEDAMF